MPESKVQPMYPAEEERPPSAEFGQVPDHVEEDEESIATASEDRIETEELNSQDDADEVNDVDLDKGNII